jgi:hypothetical protein
LKPLRPAQTPTWFCSEVVGWIGVLKKGKRAAAVGERPKARPRATSVHFYFVGFWIVDRVVMILPQVHLRKPCYDFTFL